MARISEALKQTLAYVGIRGNYPKGIRVDTRIAAYDYVVFNAEIVGGRFYELTDEAKALVHDHPFSVAHRFLTARGLRPVVYPSCKTLHYIEYTNSEGTKALLFRGGSVSIRPPFEYQNYTAEQVKDGAP